MRSSNKRALVIGATGLIGKQVVQQLLESSSYDLVRVIIRRSTNWEDSRVDQQIISFDQLRNYADLFDVDEVFCCLGTTMKKAQTKENFRKVDFEYPLIAAELAKQSGVSKFLIVTAMGADPNSIFFYSRVKGELEQHLLTLDFPAIHIFRPSLLLGEREEFRFGESVAAKISPVVNPLLPKRYQAIQGSVVAKAMIRAAASTANGTQIYMSDQIEQLAKGNDS